MFHRAAAAVVVGCTCGLSHARPVSAFWTEVDNSSADPIADATGGAVWLSEPGWRTFDLFLTSDTLVRVQGVNFGGDNNPLYRLNVIGGAIFNHPLGGRLEINAALQAMPAFNLTRFDTYAALGPLNVNGSAPGAISFVGTIAGLDAGQSSGPLLGTWFQTGGGTGQNLDPGGMFRVLRITVSESTTGVRGLMQVGLTGGAGVVDVIVPDAIPAPGAGALLLVATTATARRRR